MTDNFLTRFGKNTAAQRITLVVFLAVLVLLIGWLAVRHFSSPMRDLERAADVLATAEGFTVEGQLVGTYLGPQSPQGLKTSFIAAYDAPDQFSYVMMVPMVNSEGETREFPYYIVSRGDNHYVFQDVPGYPEGFLQQESASTHGLSLDSARSLPEFLRQATDLTLLEGEYDGQPAIVISGAGDARNYTSVIFSNFLYQTYLHVPFTIWINPDSGAPLAMELTPRQWPPVSPGERLQYVSTLIFTDFGAGEQIVPSPIIVPTPDPEAIDENEESAAPDEEELESPTPAATAEPDPDATSADE